MPAVGNAPEEQHRFPPAEQRRRCGGGVEEEGDDKVTLLRRPVPPPSAPEQCLSAGEAACTAATLAAAAGAAAAAIAHTVRAIAAARTRRAAVAAMRAAVPPPAALGPPGVLVPPAAELQPDPAALLPLKVRTLTGHEMYCEVSPYDTVFDLRHQLSESIEVCYITNYTLRARLKDGSTLPLEDAVQFCELPQVKANTVLEMVFRRYEEKDLRFHLAHLQDLLMLRLDEVVVTHIQADPIHGVALSAAALRSYPSLHRQLGDRLQQVVLCRDTFEDPDPTDDGEWDAYTSTQASLHSLEYALDINGTCAVGFTPSHERSLRDGASKRGRAIPRPAAELCEKDLDAPVSPEHFFAIANQAPGVSSAVVPPAYVTWSGFNPPPRHRRLQGDLAYLDVTFQGQGQSYQLTCTPQGFYVNQSRGRNDCNPAPAAKPHHSETLFGLLCSLNSKFRGQAEGLILRRVSLDPYETSPLPAPTARPWLVAPEAVGSNVGMETGQRADCVPAALDQHAPIRDWNEEAQSLLELPRKTPEEQQNWDRHAQRVHGEFIDYATRAAIASVEGQMAPVNPADPPTDWYFLINGIFVSYATDPPRGTAPSPDQLTVTRAMGKGDVRGVAAIREVGPLGIATTNTAVIDFKGKCALCQSVLPGLLQSTPEGKAACRLAYGYCEERRELLSSPEWHEAVRPLAAALGFAEQAVTDTRTGVTHTLALPTCLRGMDAADGRRYVLECARTTPRDFNWPSTPVPCFHRRELFTAFRASRSAADGKPVLVNCDLGCEMTGMESADPPELRAEQEGVLRDMAAYLRDTVLPEAAAFLALSPPIDSAGLTAALHRRGIGMRYLGKLWELLPECAASARALLELEMCARVLKRRLRAAMGAALHGDVAAAVSRVLSAAVAVHPAGVAAGEDDGDGPDGEDEAKGGKAGTAKRKRKKRQSSRPEGADAGPGGAGSVADEVLARFAHHLAPGWEDRIGRWRLLRALCMKTGVILQQRIFDFSSPTPVQPEDVRDVQPVAFHCPPGSGIVDRLIKQGLDAMAGDTLDDGGKALEEALQYCYQVKGAVAAEPLRCYSAQALSCLLMGETEQAVLNQRKALVVARRLRGPDAAALVQGLLTMGVCAWAVPRARDAAAFMRRALYIARLVCGFVPAEVAACLGGLYQDNGMDEEAVPLLRNALARFEATVAALSSPPLSPPPSAPAAIVEAAAGRLSRARVSAALCGQQLALSLVRLGAAAEAVPLQKRALTGFEQVYAPRDLRCREADGLYKQWVAAAVQSGKGNTAQPPARSRARGVSPSLRFLEPEVFATTYLVPLLRELDGL
eukprot:TRINITY_DN4314_c0_g1_i1.p1 TRINITY_DN4314_c0_g1~~TRINITY_DN4314_c0_g1_i1.p1  ORF type:complete len:1317 (+),score=346.41 TRINITY_DN4314_c0_g1_i1:91-4041(+)